MAKTTASTPQGKAADSTNTGSRPVTRRATAGGDTARRQSPSVSSFFQESRSELKKVTWPTRQDAMNLTLAVIAMTAALSAVLGLVDGLLDQLIKPLIG